jgi:two-component system phosphate regulon sensor histidine kinase PhoR
LNHMNSYLNHLASLIAERPDDIVRRWKEAACKLPRAEHLAEPLLLDHMPQLLRELSSALTEEAQSLSILGMTPHESAAQHGAIRFRLGFDVEEVIAEFGMLRDVIQLFAEHYGINISAEVNRTINRVIDKAIAVSLQTYVRQQAEEVEQKRQQYLSFIVHDLKTPISAIATAAYVIEQKLTDNIQSSATGKMLGIVRRNATQLSNRVLELINEESRLRALTAAPNLPLDLRTLDLWPIAERLKQDCQSIAESRRNTIRNEVPLGLQISADPDLLLEGLQNLVSNALKYTRNGEIVIGGAENADSVTCWVRDTGTGIPPDRIDRIFERRAGDPDVPESTGLGLIIVAKVIQLHGGTISVESTPGVGTTFRMKFLKTYRNAA